MWFAYINGVVSGPFSDEELLSLATSGSVTPETRVCQEDGNWWPAKAIEGLFNQAAATAAPPSSPPPPPPPPVAPTPVPSAVVPIRTFTSEADEGSHESKFKKEDTFFALSIPEGPISCPHCWLKFGVENLNYIASHPALSGDPVLGEDAQLRFLPTVFNSAGVPSDAKGMLCTEMACPRCHLRIPASIVDHPSLYFSIVGAPGSGKSYFLASMVNTVKRSLAFNFDINFADSDPSINFIVNKYEQVLFLSAAPEKLATLPKTQQIGKDFSSRVLMNGIQMDLPKPFVFLTEPTVSFERKDGLRESVSSNIVLYDNAGEHFQPGSDVVGNPATQHLAHSDGIIFVMDPTEDVQLRRRCDEKDPQISERIKITDQSILLTEMILRIRKNLAMKPGEKCHKPLIVVVGKFDLWETLIPSGVRENHPVRKDSQTMSRQLDLATIANVSFSVRSLLLKYAPEIVTRAEAFFSHVIFVPVSNFGTHARKNEQGAVGIQPDLIKPIWVDVPLLLLLERLQFIPGIQPPLTAGTPIDQYEFKGDSLVFSVPDVGRFQVPAFYAGMDVPIKNRLYRLPEQPKAATKKAQSGIGSFWES